MPGGVSAVGDVGRGWAGVFDGFAGQDQPGGVGEGDEVYVNLPRMDADEHGCGDAV